MARKFFTWPIGTGFALALISTLVVAAEPVFEIRGYAEEGAPLLAGGDFSRLVAPFIGKRKTAEDITNAQRAVQQAYHDLGQCLVKVGAGQREPESGAVTFKITQAAAPRTAQCPPLARLDPPVILDSEANSAMATPRRMVAAAATSPAQANNFSDTDVRRLAGFDVTAMQPLSEDGPAPQQRAQAKPLQVRKPILLAQAPASGAPALETDTPVSPVALKFDIDRFVVQGNTLLDKREIDRALKPFTGKQRDFGDVQKALEALQLAYQKRGWGVVQVSLPEQELERGEVRFEVVEVKIGKVKVEGNEYFSEANIRRSVPSLKEGQTPNSLAMARSLRVANENPVKQSQLSLKAGSNENEIDATMRVVDDNPRKYSLSFDNTGTDSTGRFRLGMGFQHSNLWDRDHQLTLQYITNPEHPSKVTVLGAGYHIPLYGRGDSIDLVVGYSDVDSGTVQQLFNVSGAGLIALARYNLNLKRIDEYEHKISFGLDYKAFQSRVLTTSGVGLVPDITLHPLSLAYSGEWRDERNTLNFYTSFSYNAFPGGNDGAQSDFKASRGSAGGASAEYAIWRAGVNYQRLLPKDFSFRFVANAQTTRNALVAGEQFGVGGANSVRGFNERVYSNDKGHQATFELMTPELADKVGFEGGRLRFLAFYDTGNLSRNFIQPGEQTGIGVDSVGIGLRMTYKERFNLRLDYAQVLHDGGMDAGRPDGRRGSNTLHAAALLVF